MILDDAGDFPEVADFDSEDEYCDEWYPEEDLDEGIEEGVCPHCGERGVVDFRGGVVVEAWQVRPGPPGSDFLIVDESRLTRAQRREMARHARKQAKHREKQERKGLK
jgi:hypothetical protein